MNLTSLVRSSTRAITASLLMTAVAIAGGTPYSKIIVFGDSLSDTGNASMLTGGFYPASPPNAEGRISNGAIWVEYLAETLGMEIQPENQYAVAGACSGFGNFSSVAYGIPQLAGTGLQWQIATFLEDSGPGEVDPDALYTVWIGANDIFTTLTFGGDMHLTVSQAIQNTAGAVATLASRGGAPHSGGQPARSWTDALRSIAGSTRQRGIIGPHECLQLLSGCRLGFPGS